MMRDAIVITRVAGIPIRLHWSWFLVLGLITWTLAAGYFPDRLPEASTARAWVYGLVAALLLFGSVLLHELSHALVARRTGLPVAGITLHVFGGVSQLEREPESPRAEFLMAAVGPLTSYAIALGSWLALRLGVPMPAAQAILLYVAGVNVLVGTFNLVPGFPLDGGRLLRSALWAWRGDLAWATRISTRAGAAAGFALLAWGGFRILGGDLVGGLWLVLIGMFLQQAAGASYDRLLARRALERVPVSAAMTRDVVTVPAGATVAELVDRYFWTRHVTSFPVVESGVPAGRVVGLVTIGHVKGVPRERWPSTVVRDVMTRLGEDTTIAPTASSWDALGKLTVNGVGRLAVLQAGRLVGYLSIRDVVHLLTLDAAGRRGIAQPGGPVEQEPRRPPMDRAA